MLPARYVGYAIKADVKWNPETRTGTFTTNKLQAKVTLDNKVVEVKHLDTGKIEKVILTSEPLLRKDRTLLPVSEIGKIFGLTHGNDNDNIDQDIEWNHKTHSALIIIEK